MSVRWRRWSPLAAAIVLLAVVAGVPAIRGSMLRAAGRVLVVDEPLERADIIVVPQWAGAGGVIDAADLVHTGTAGGVAVLPGPPRPAERELMRRGISYKDEPTYLVELLHALGVKNVEVIPNPAAGSDAEGQVLPPWCDQHQFRTIIVVSAPDHSRRMRRVLHRSMRGHSTKVVIRSARYSSFDPDRWWEERDGIRIEIMELQKLLLDVARHPIS